MVAETVKSYPYSALPILAQQDLNYSCSTSSCSPSLMPYGSPPRQRMDRTSLPSIASVSNASPGGLGAGGLMGSSQIIKDSIFAQRKQREFIPDSKKDENYWDRRRRNNEAAKRSREKRRFNDMILEQRVLELSKENHLLRAKLNALEAKFQVKGDGLVNEDQVIANMPQTDQILALTRRSNISLLTMAAQQPSQSSSLLSPNSLPSSPPSHVPSSTSAMQEDDHYSIPQYNQENSNISLHNFGRSHSPEQCPSEPHHPQQTYSPEPPHSFYESSSSALNLSARRSPLPMDYCEDQPGRSEYNACLPHKLRHKTGQQLSMSMRAQCVSPSEEHQLPPTAPHHYQPSHRNSSASPSRSSPSTSHTLMYPIKSEPMSRELGEESPGSSDDRDSGVSVSPTLPGEPSYPMHVSRDIPDEMEMDNEQLRQQVERLTSEVHNLKHFLNRGSDHRSSISRR